MRNVKMTANEIILIFGFNPNAVIRPQYVWFLFLWHCFLTSFIFLSASCLSLELDVARYACVPKPNNLLDNKTKYV